MSTLDRETGLDKPVHYCGWFLSGWFRLSLGGVVLLAVVTGLITDAPGTYILGQIVLGLSVYISLSFLADRPLINPLQAVVFVFYYWIGVGPAVVSAWKLLADVPKEALAVQISGMEALWVVAPGLLLYTIAVRLTLRCFSGTGVYARFLLPTGANYSQNVLIAYFVMAVCAEWGILLLSLMGIVGLEEMSALGGTKTIIWWIGVILAISQIKPLLSSALMMVLAAPWTTIPFGLRILIAATIWQTGSMALFSGWKGPLALLAAYYVAAYMRWKQRPPWLLITVAALFFVLFITPYVNYGRWVAANTKANQFLMGQIYSEALSNPFIFLPRSFDQVDVAVFFRGISPLAGELTRRNGFFEGEWDGETIWWGLEILVPRVFLPEKRDMNIGNFFARTVGADLGVSERFDTLNNLAISIPFEFVGNFGLFGGFLSFGLIGVFWTLLSVWLLSPDRLSDHPLTPFLVLFSMQMEGGMGPFLSQLRNLMIPLLIMYFFNKIVLRGKV